MKRVLITGGAGFIGSHTADQLLANGVPVRVLDNLSSGFRSNLPSSHDLLEFIEGDITDSKAVAKAMQDVSHCVHLAAQVSVVASLEDPVHSAMQNIIGFVNVLTAAKNESVERLVYASSAAIYGEPSEIPLAEAAQKTQLSPYGLEKFVNEEYADLYKRLYQFSSLGMRFFNVYGPRQDPASPYAGVIALFVDRISKGMPLKIFGDGMQTRDFVFIEDVARTIIAALGLSPAGACNVGTGVQTTLLDLVKVLEEITGNETELEFNPPREGDIKHSLARVEKMNQQLDTVAATSIKSGLERLIASLSSG